jgi:phosphoglucomutase
MVSTTNDRIELPTSNVLQFVTADGSKITVRPSGTEPKIKFYFSVCEALNPEQSMEEAEEILAKRIDALKKDLGLL